MTTTYAKVVLCLILCCLTGMASPGHLSADAHLAIDLSGEWEIRLDDTMPLPEKGGPHTWEAITLPGNIARYANETTGSYIGIAWLKKTVFIPERWQGQNLGLSMGRITHGDETYVNGVQIGGEGRFPPDEMSMWHIPRFYVVPKTVIRPGEDNVILIKIWFHTYGNVDGDLYLSHMAKWKQDRANALFMRIVLNYIIIAIGATLFVIFMLFYLQRPDSAEYFFYSLQLLCGIFIILDLCTFWRFPGGITMRFKLVALSWIALNVVHPMFLHRLYHLGREKIEWILFFFLLLTLPFFFVIREDQLREFGVWVVFISATMGFYTFTCHLSAIYLKKPFSRTFSLFGITVILGAFHDGLVYLSKLMYFELPHWGFLFDYMLLPISATALFLGTAIIWVYRFIELLKANEDLNENLEHKVAERTRSLILLTEELEEKNITLRDIAIRDSLTGLYNHAAFCDRLDEIFITSRRYKTPMALAMIDVDDFKGVNDTYGHQVGDEVLRGIATVLKTCIREYNFSEKFEGQRMGDNRNYDLAGRYGGDEFMIVLPHCPLKDARKVMERIRLKIKNIPIENHPNFRISGSFGVAVLLPHTHCPNSDALITLADMALYKSKAMGKNQVYCTQYEAP